MIHHTDRAKHTLRAIRTYAKLYDRWPASPDLRRFKPKLGSHASISRALEQLRALGLIELRGHTSTSRWVLTTAGWEYLALPRFEPGKEVKRARAAAAALLDQDHLSPNRRREQAFGIEPAAFTVTGQPIHE